MSTAASAQGLSNYPTADVELGERLGDTEIEDAKALAADLSNTIRREYVAGGARRDAHPKAHGCVAAEFRVEADLPPELSNGVFQPGAEYQTTIRFSNGSPNATGHDADGDTRGMAIKLHGVEGEKLFADPQYPDAQDFVLISSPYFFINGSHGYTEFFRIINAGDTLPMLKIPFILGMKGTINAAKMLSQTIANPLDVRYFSVTPYQLGLGDEREAVKYSARPCGGETGDEAPEGAERNFLRHAMQDRLSREDACFEFLIQPRGEADLEIEDVVTEWSEDEAPFVKVAQITIPEQHFDDATQNAACEDLSYNPWHALPEHRPLGTINRMRRVVYETISDLRHDMNE
jgi:catalase